MLALAMLGCVAGAVLVVAPNAQAARQVTCKDKGVFYLRNSRGKVLDVKQRGTADGTPVVLWQRNGGRNQQWRHIDCRTPEGYFAWTELRGVGSGKCLEVSRDRTVVSGSSVRIYTCLSGTGQEPRHQRWTAWPTVPRPSEMASQMGTPMGETLYLDVDTTTGEGNGARIQVHSDLHGRWNQLWSFVKA